METNRFVKKSLTTLCLLMLLALGASAGAAEVNDAAALRGIKEGKGVYLVSLDNPQKLALYLEIIKETHRSMAAQGVKPDIVLVFVGASVRFLVSEPEPELAEAKPALQSVAGSVQDLNRLGVRQEVCVIATELFKVPLDRLLPGLIPVGNGFNSLIGYQAKGYGLVPIF